MRRPEPRPIPTALALAVLVWAASGLGGCAPALRDAAMPVAPAEAARWRRDCPAGSFLGAMTINCPQPVE